MHKQTYHVFVGYQPLTDPIGPIGAKVERFIWGDSRAQHTFLIFAAESCPMIIMEIQPSSSKRLLLEVSETNELRQQMLRTNYLGVANVDIKYLTRLGVQFTTTHRYHFYSKNCRTFVEHLVAHIPEFNNLPRLKNSILDYQHKKNKNYLRRRKTNCKQPLLAENHRTFLTALQLGNG
jgi:hypothetical protein